MRPAGPARQRQAPSQPAGQPPLHLHSINAQYKISIDVTAVDYPSRVLRFEVVYNFIGDLARPALPCCRPGAGAQAHQADPRRPCHGRELHHSQVPGPALCGAAGHSRRSGPAVGGGAGGGRQVVRWHGRCRDGSFGCAASRSFLPHAAASAAMHAQLPCYCRSSTCVLPPSWPHLSGLPHLLPLQGRVPRHCVRRRPQRPPGQPARCAAGVGGQHAGGRQGGAAREPNKPGGRLATARRLQGEWASRGPAAAGSPALPCCCECPVPAACASAAAHAGCRVKRRVWGRSAGGAPFSHSLLL